MDCNTHQVRSRTNWPPREFDSILLALYATSHQDSFCCFVADIRSTARYLGLRRWRAMIVSCPECANKLRVNVEGSNRIRIRCPKCSKSFVLNAGQEDEDDDIERPSVKS